DRRRRLIGIAAAETATKEFIAKMCPAIERLVRTMPSHPLPKLLTEDVPEMLAARGATRRVDPQPRRNTLVSPAAKPSGGRPARGHARGTRSAQREVRC